ncbi:MAG: L,D-transpeptidase family protein [Chitinophagaceae bacterium]|nr:L,D-transpeptidase family protein [Chitinophagaceae bacterium]
MNYNTVCLRFFVFILFGVMLIIFSSCRRHTEFEKKVREQLVKNIRDFQHSVKNKSEQKTKDALSFYALTDSVYLLNDYFPFWSQNNSNSPLADSLFHFIRSSYGWGLFPEDYHFAAISRLRNSIITDSSDNQRMKSDFSLWSKMDILLTDAFITLWHHIKLGRLGRDSISMKKDSVIQASEIFSVLRSLKKTGELTPFFRSLEPSHWGYHELKNSLKSFLAKADLTKKRYIPVRDSLLQVRAVEQLLKDSGFLNKKTGKPDSLTMSNAVKQLQRSLGLPQDGKMTRALVNRLNNNDYQKFLSIAITLDKYKQLPDTMPPFYLWVNAASNYMYIIDNDSINLESKVICGKPTSPTPSLNSAISSIITYPKWIPPASIVSREILPAVSRNPGYLNRRGFVLLDRKGKRINPYAVNWKKYSKGIPYRIVQLGGDANAMGAIKFYFDNDYAVYLHDTNQKYLFSRSKRSLSHGCVRVQEWEKLAYWLIRKDSLMLKSKTSRSDSLQAWLTQKKYKEIKIENPIPVFIRYLSCEGKKGTVIFYEDLYGEDEKIKIKYFSRN